MLGHTTLTRTVSSGCFRALKKKIIEQHLHLHLYACYLLVLLLLLIVEETDLYFLL